MKYDHYAKITRPAESDTSDSETESGGTDYEFDPEPSTDPDNTTSNPITIYENYPCKIIEKVTSYDTSEEGQNYTGKSKMKGMLTDKLQKGDIVDGSFVIVGKPRIVQNRETVCQLVRIN